MIRIGDFARLACVSVRALRHYEAKGLLRPGHVDTRSRYRYYDLQQLATLERLLLLKALGLPLHAIRDLLGATDSQFRAALASHRRRLQSQVLEREAMLARLRALESWLETEYGNRDRLIVRTKSYPEVRALTLRAIVSRDSSAITEMFEAVERRARPRRADQPPILLMHHAPQVAPRQDVEVCIPVTRACRLADVRDIEPEPNAASITYSGPYLPPEDLYRRMCKWVGPATIDVGPAPDSRDLSPLRRGPGRIPIASTSTDVGAATLRHGVCHPCGGPPMTPFAHTSALLVLLFLAMRGALAADGDLPRRANALPERYEKATLELGTVRDARGERLRTLTTVPRVEGKLPAIFLAGWLSCDSVEIPASGGDGVARLLRQLITDTGAIVARMDKPGVGDSEGNCAEIDFDTELSGYRNAFRTLRAHPRADPTRIVLLGISNGGGFSPLIVEDAPVAGFVSIGGWSKTWFEHMIELERRRLALEGHPRAAISSEVKALSELYAGYLLERRTPAEVIQLNPTLKTVWYDEPAHQYGRPATYYHQLQTLDLGAAWSRVAVPALIVWGEYDWIMSREDQTMIVDSINANAPGRARLLTVPRMDHSFSTHATPKAAFDRMGSGDYPQAAAAEIVAFIRATVARRVIGTPGCAADTRPPK